MPPARLRPAVVGGLFIGVLSALPVVSAANICCCLWLVVGGGLAAWVMQQNHPYPVTPADGAAVGALAGIAGAFVYLVLSWPIAILMGPMMEEWVERALENAGDVPWRDVFERYRGAGVRTFSVLVGFVLQLVLGAIFATLGGLVGAMIFKKPGPPVPAGPPMPPPLPPPPPAAGDAPDFRSP